MIAQVLLTTASLLLPPVSISVNCSWSGLGERDLMLSERDTLPVTDIPLSPVLGTQFIALARERGPRQLPDWSDMQTTIWEIRPDRVGAPAVRRCVLGQSHWRVTPVLDSPSVLRWEVPKAGHAPAVRVMRVDYSNFEISQLYQGDQLDVLDQWGDKLYFRTFHEKKILDVSNGVLTPQDDAIELLVWHENDWLVELNGALARFDAASARLVRRYPQIKIVPVPGYSVEPLWDGGRFAVYLGSFVNESGVEILSLGSGRVEIIYRNLCLWDLELGSERKVRVRIQASAGSGFAICPTDVHLKLNGDRLRYTECFPVTEDDANLRVFGDERDTEWVTIDLLSTAELNREPFRKVAIEESEPSPVESSIPEYLRDLHAQSPIRIWGDGQDLAFASLTHKGIEFNLPSEGVWKLDGVCMTQDGNELLVLNRGVFYLCNLETESLKQWPAPKALDMRDSIDLFAIEM